MSRLNRSEDRRISEPMLRKALARLKPPTDTMLLDQNMVNVSRKLDAVLKRGGTKSRQVQRLLDEFTSSSTPIMHTRGGAPTSPFISKDHHSIFEILQGLYLPTDEPAFYVPAERRYFDNQIATGAVGSASAYKNNGKLTTIQMVDLNANQESTWAGVYIMFKTDLAHYGQVSRITFEPNIDWRFRDFMDSNAVWLDRVAHLDGTVQFTARIWLTGYEFNVATNKFDPILPPSAVKFQVWQSTYYVTALGETGMSGSLRNGAATFKFIASPARTYALGVLLQLTASHNLHNAAGGSIPKPQSGDFTQYALFKADVPEMWLSHEVLAK
ncbi:MAG: hypothetical protein HZB51_21280 [Chloroflexi bacterium]|nr:hypothetical protein [Chloroflexota bacterium]